MKEKVVATPSPEETEIMNLNSSVTIDLPLPAYIPTDYIPEMNLRIQLYRRIASIENEAMIDHIEAELQDRFGTLPKAIQGLLYQIRVKLMAQVANVSAIAHENGRIMLKLPYLASVDRAAFQEYLGREVRVSRTAIWIPSDFSMEVWQNRLLEVLNTLNRDHISSVFMSDMPEVN
jgi:transcription-repair coupling factor (superfamily II helicase)